MPPTYCLTGNQRDRLVKGTLLRDQRAGIPGRTHEGVHGVGFAAGWLTAAGARHETHDSNWASGIRLADKSALQSLTGSLANGTAPNCRNG